MTSAGKAYFRYHLRSKWKLLLCITVIALVLTLFYSSGQKIEYSYYTDEPPREVYHVEYDSTLGTSLTVLLICSSILPVMEFAFFKKRRNLDCVYGLPITRREMGMIHYITGLTCVVIPYTCAYLVNFLFVLRYPEGFDYWPLLGYYFLNLVLALCAYSVNVFIFNRANTTLDGICFMILCNFVGYAVVSTWNAVSLELYRNSLLEYTDYPMYYAAWEQKWAIPNGEMSNTFGAMSEIEWIFVRTIEKEYGATTMHFWGEWSYVGWVVFWVIAGIASTFGFVFNFGNGRTENAEEVSDSWFGYKVLIPLYTYLGIIMLAGAGFIVITIFAFVGYLFYRRGFHLKKCDWITLVSTLLLAFLSLMILGIAGVTLL